MTQQLDAAITQSPEVRVQAWLVDFESALAARDIERVVAKFLPDSIWRDLVTFTWNIKTVEGRERIADMLRARLADTDPSGFRTRETPTDDGGGVASAFIEFETAVGRGVVLQPRHQRDRAGALPSRPRRRRVGPRRHRGRCSRHRSRPLDRQRMGARRHSGQQAAHRQRVR